MPVHLSNRRFNKAIIAAELAGHKTFAGAPCKFDPSHIDEDGTTVRDTIRKTCCACENRHAKAWRDRNGV